MTHGWSTFPGWVRTRIARTCQRRCQKVAIRCWKISMQWKSRCRILSPAMKHSFLRPCLWCSAGTDLSSGFGVWRHYSICTLPPLDLRSTAIHLKQTLIVEHEYPTLMSLIGCEGMKYHTTTQSMQWPHFSQWNGRYEKTVSLGTTIDLSLRLSEAMRLLSWYLQSSRLICLVTLAVAPVPNFEWCDGHCG